MELLPAIIDRSTQVAEQYLDNLRNLNRDAQLFLLGSAFFALGMNSFFVIYNLYILELGFNEAVVGRINAASVFGLAVGSVPAGALADRFSSRKVVLAAIIFSLVTLSLRALSGSEPTLLASSFLQGLGYTSFWVASPALIADTTLFKDRSLVFSLNGLIGGLIAIPGNLLTGALPQIYGGIFGVSLLWGERLTLLSMLGFMIPAFLVFRQLSGILPTHSIKGLDPDDNKEVPPMNPAADLSIFPLFIYIALVATLIGFADGFFFPFGNIFFQQQYNFGTARIGSVFATTQVLVVILFILLPVLTRQWKKSNILASSRFAAIPFLGALSLELPWWLAWPSFSLAQSTFRFTMVITDNLIVDVAPRASRARATGVRSLCLSLGAIAANTAGGWLIANRGYQIPILGSVVLGGMLGLSLIFFFSPREPAPSSIRENPGGLLL